MMSICDTCHKVLKEGSLPITHGKCRLCELDFYAKMGDIKIHESIERFFIREWRAFLFAWGIPYGKVKKVH